jgi:GNAT superfamily N-acetyltransferase
MGAPRRHPQHSHPETQIRRVNWAEDLATVRQLLVDYRAWIADHTEVEASGASPAGLTKYDQEIAGLPGVYGPPRGDVLLAADGRGLAACGSLREVEPGVGEIKRVFVRADHRGPGFGPRFTGALLDRALELGYARVRVDTLPSMEAAIEFYQAMGFTPIPAYWPHPVAGELFFEYDFTKSGTKYRGPGPAGTPPARD